MFGCLFAWAGERYRQSLAEQATLRTLAEAFPNAQIYVWYQSQKETDGGFTSLPRNPESGVFKWLVGDSFAFERVAKIRISCPPEITMFGGRSSTAGGFEPSETNQDYSTLPNLRSLRCLEEIDIAIDNLKSLDGLSEVTSLRKITLFECCAIKNVDALAGLTNLTQLEIRRCDSLEDLDGICGLTQLTSVEIFGCDSLVSAHEYR